MSKIVKDYLTRDYKRCIEGVDDALVVSVRGIGANENNRMRLSLAEKDIRITVMRNSLAKKAIVGSGLENLGSLMAGPTALAYGAESVVEVARELVKWAAEVKELELKGAILDGELFEGEAAVKRLSDFPTRDEAIAQTVTLILSPARNLVSQMAGPAGALMGVIKSIEEKLEKGEAIAKVG